MERMNLVIQFDILIFFITHFYDEVKKQFTKRRHFIVAMLSVLQFPQARISKSLSHFVAGIEKLALSHFCMNFGLSKE